MKTCCVEGCNNKHLAKGYCDKHYKQIKKYGKILDRTRYDLNEIVIHGDYAEIILYNKNQDEVGRALIDLEDVDRVKNIRWGFSCGYAVNSNTGISLHRFIMDCPKGKVIDHINHNPLDNRKCNLRICSQQENIMNKSKQSNNTTGHTGVYWRERDNKWEVYICVNYKLIYLGQYDNKEEAIEARKKAEIKYFGEYRNKE